MSDLESRKIFFVIGEESGDALGADLLDALHQKAASSGFEIEPIGLAGERMAVRGVKSLFDISEIAVMGITAVLAKLPRIIRRISSTVAEIVKQQPSVIVLIDSPDFTHAVAKRVRKKCPHIPVINYVCPSVWAWRQGRARKMVAYVDHVLALLPFEPDALAKLNGPASTYVGHRLIEEMREFLASAGKQNKQIDPVNNPVLLVLPGSRKVELKCLLDIFGETVEFLSKRGIQFDCIIPSVPRLVEEIRMKTRNWAVQPEIVVGIDARHGAFHKATAALAVSGTISLELALAGIPMVLAYKLDFIIRPFGFLIKTWSAALPNLIADYVVVPEEVNETATCGRLGRHLERLLKDTPERKAQIEGLALVVQNMRVDQPPGQKAADIVLSFLSINSK